MLAKDEFEECVALLSAYYEDQKYAMQDVFPVLNGLLGKLPKTY